MAKTYQFEDNDVVAIYVALKPVAKPAKMPKINSAPWYRMQLAKPALDKLESQMPADVLRELAPDPEDAPAEKAPSEGGKKGLFK